MRIQLRAGVRGQGASRRANVVVGVEALEGRALLATSSGTFTAPDLSSYIRQADSGANTGPAAIQTMLTSLQSQATSGALADFNSGSADAAGFLTEVTNLVTSYQSNVDAQLSPRFPNIDNILKLEGASLVSAVTAVNTRVTSGVLASGQQAQAYATAINALTAGPTFALNTPISGYRQATTNLETQLNTLAAGLSSTATTPLTTATVVTVAGADIAAYEAAVDASLATYPNVNQQVNTATTSLSNAVTALPQSTDPQTYLTQAVTTFDTTVMGTGGVFSTTGAFARYLNSGRG